ncbi:MAG: hypothetical protein QGH74_03630 [Candidatus Brocadiia bacterium]|nr:hypothetical protein [Candidatus Brocadiia bacterium]
MIYKREEYIEENPEDQKFPVKHIDVLDPLDGSAKKFIGHVTLGLQTPMGVQQIPVSFEIPAETTTEAFRRFVEAAEPKLAETQKGLEEELQRLRQESSSRIVRPGEVGLPPSGGGVVDFKNLKK